MERSAGRSSEPADGGSISSISSNHNVLGVVVPKGDLAGGCVSKVLLLELVSQPFSQSLSSDTTDKETTMSAFRNRLSGVGETSDAAFSEEATHLGS